MALAIWQQTITDESGDKQPNATIQVQRESDGYSVPLNFVPAINGLHSYVKGWKQLANGWWWLQYVWLDK